MARLPTASKPFKILVANLAGGSDPSLGRRGNPVKVRTGFVMQLISEVPSVEGDSKTLSPWTPGTTTRMGLLDYTTGTTPVASTGTIQVIENNFQGGATLFVGPYVLSAGTEFDVGATADETATFIAAAIDGLEPFTASAVGDTVTVTGPFGLVGNTLPFSFESTGAYVNFALMPSGGFFNNAEPTLGPPQILG